MKLHLGCGDKYLPGFINIDTRPLPHIDVVMSADCLIGFNNESVELIYACHLLEHFGRHQVKDVLTEWYRVLQPGGLLRLAVPDFDAIVCRYMQTKNLKEVLGLLVGGQTYQGNEHRTIFNFRTLAELLYNVGFSNVFTYDWRETIHQEFDDYSQAYLPHMDKDYGLLMSLNVEAIKGK